MRNSYEAGFKQTAALKATQRAAQFEKVKKLRAEGLTMRDIASRLGISESKVEVLLRKARAS